MTQMRPKWAKWNQLTIHEVKGPRKRAGAPH